MRQLRPNHWTTSDHHRSAGPVGGLYSWRGDARDQFAQYVCSHAWEQAKRRHQEGEGAGCALCQEEEKTQRPGRLVEMAEFSGLPPLLPIASHQTRQLSIMVNGRRLCWPHSASAKPRLYAWSMQVTNRIGGARKA